MLKTLKLAWKHKLLLTMAACVVMYKVPRNPGLLYKPQMCKVYRLCTCRH